MEKRTMGPLLLAGAVGALVLLPFLYLIDSQDSHGDETQWILNAEDFWLFRAGRFHDSRWAQEAAHDPPVGKYILGLALAASGHGPEELARIRPWNWRESVAWNQTHGAIPPPGIRHVCRAVMALLGAATCLLLGWIGWRAVSLRAGIATALLLAYHPLMVTSCCRAMTDAPLQFFLCAGLALSLLFKEALEEERAKRTLALAALAGLAAGLAAGTKLNGALGAAAFAAVCAAAWRRGRRRLLAQSLVLAGLAAVATFIGLNPALYRHPALTLMAQAERYRWIYRLFPDRLLPSLHDRALFVIWRTLCPGEGNFAALGSVSRLPAAFVLFFLGCYRLARVEMRQRAAGAGLSGAGVLGVWMLVACAGITIWIPEDWDRYYLTVVVYAAAAQGCAIDALIEGSGALGRSLA